MAEPKTSFYQDDRRTHLIVEDEDQDGHLGWQGITRVKSDKPDSYSGAILSVKNRAPEFLDQLANARAQCVRASSPPGVRESAPSATRAASSPIVKASTPPAIRNEYEAIAGELGVRSRGAAGIVFQPIAGSEFEALVRFMSQVVVTAAGNSGMTVDSADDTSGFRWLVVRGDKFDDLAAGTDAASSALETGGYGERILCAVYAFEDHEGRPLYLIYDHKRRAFHPFVPVSGDRRDNDREQELKGQIGNQLPIEQEVQRWYPLWGMPI